MNDKGINVCQFPQFVEKTHQVIFEKTKSIWIPLPISFGEIGSNTSQDYKAIVLGLRDYVLKSNFHKVVIGLSGGIDLSLIHI